MIRAQPPQSSKKLPPNKPAVSKTAAARAARTTVLHLCPTLDPGDPARETVDLAILTQRAGWRALIVSGGGLLVPEAERAAVRHTRMPVDRHGLLTNWRNRVHLEALIQRERPALIHAHGIEALLHAFGLCRTHRLPLVADLTQPLPEPPRVYRLLGQLNDINCTIRVPSDFMFGHLRQTFHLAPERMRIIAPGIDLQWFNAGSISPQRLQALSALWRMPEQATVIVMPMPLMPEGGQRQLLQALTKLKRDDVFAVLVGNDRQAPGTRGEIENLIRSHGLSGKVIMPEHCMDWPAACWLASVIATPNIVPRGQIMELLAAQAIGRPVIVSDCGANAEMVLSGETAWLIPPGDIKTLTETLQEATHLHTEQRLDLAARTRDFIAQSFPQADWFNAMMELYEEMLAPSARKPKAKAA